MPRVRPPGTLPGTPTKVMLPAGTRLYRIHSAARDATESRRIPSDCLWGGGRFDATPCEPYGFCYAGLSVQAAVCETLLRSVPFDPGGAPRALPRATVAGRRLSFLRLGTEVTLASLMSGQDLAAVAQDSWLVHAEAAEYPFTRDWGHWIRRQCAPWAQGFVWPSKRDPAHRSAVLFEDRCPPRALATAQERAVDFDAPHGRRWLNGVLEPYRAQLAP
jgi:RES domain